MMRNRSSDVKGRRGTGEISAGEGAPGREVGAVGLSAEDPGDLLLSGEHGGVLFGVWLVGRATIEAIDRQIAASGLSAMEFPVYCLLALTGGMTPSALGSWMAAPPTTVSALVKRLEGRGHAVRRPNPADRRSYLVALTEQGRAAQDLAVTEFGPMAETVQAALGPRAQRVRDDLLELRRALDLVRTSDARGGAT
jgi:DNA-binding MarR family transcriptional regulator